MNAEAIEAVSSAIAEEHNDGMEARDPYWEHSIPTRAGDWAFEARAALAFIRDAIHRDGPDADAIRETLGLRAQRRHLCACGGDWGGFSHTMSDRHEPLGPSRRVVGEWQEVQS